MGKHGLFDDVPLAKYATEYGEQTAKWLEDNEIRIDWHVKERNKQWHDAYFTKAAVKDHQAKGNCRFLMYIFEELENCDLLFPGDIILDHMCGIGSTLIVAALKGYAGFGIELEETFYLDMVGYDFRDTIDDENSLLAGFSAEQHVEGNIERFNKLLGSRKSVGSIQVVQGDARAVDKILAGEVFQTYVGGSFGGVAVVNSPPYSASTEVGGGSQKSRSQHYTAAVVSSPPYGNRFRDASQQFGAKDKRTLEEIGKASRDQYGHGSENIGNLKITVVNSPPYSRSTEHDASQIDAMPPEKKIGHQGFKYEGGGNIALLDVDPYRREMKKVYKALYKALPAGSPVVLITRNFIQEGRVVWLDKLTISMMKVAGFQYMFTKRATLPEISFFKYLNWKKMHKEKGLPLIDWEEATFYMKER